MEVFYEYQPNFCKDDVKVKTPRQVMWITPNSIQEFKFLEEVSKNSSGAIAPTSGESFICSIYDKTT